MSEKLFIWFLLVDSQGQPYNKTSSTKVSFTSSPDIADFCDAVRSKYSDSHLQGVASSDLKVYKNKTAFDDNEVYLKPSFLIDGLGKTEENCLIVFVPSPLTDSFNKKGVFLSTRYLTCKLNIV